MKYIRACAVCNSYFPPTDWLCSLCWKAVEREYLYSEDSYRVEKNFSHLRLMDWAEDNHHLIKFFISSLKQGGPDFLFKRLGLEMFSRFVHFDLWDKKSSPIFIPAPPHKKSQKDHAFQLAEALNFYFGGELKNTLARKNKKSQKLKSRRQRGDIQMQSQESFCQYNRPIVFVDDVLTTGSTARSAFQALNQPKHFFVFTLAWKRPKSSEP